MEYDHFTGSRVQHAGRIAESIDPVQEAGLLDLIAGDHRIDQDVTIRSAPGHTPGHLVVQVTGAGHIAMIVGDLLHHPMQLRHPDISSARCTHPKEAVITRTAVLGELADQNGILLATHLLHGGTISRSDTGFVLRHLT